MFADVALESLISRNMKFKVVTRIQGQVPARPDLKTTETLWSQETCAMVSYHLQSPLNMY